MVKEQETCVMPIKRRKDIDNLTFFIKQMPVGLSVRIVCDSFAERENTRQAIYYFNRSAGRDLGEQISGCIGKDEPVITLTKYQL